MQNCDPLAWYGLTVLILTGSMIFVPYLRRKSDLFTAWNFLLAGIAIFVGLGCIEAASSPMRFPGLDWFDPTAAEVNWYMLATGVFLVTLFAAYYLDPISKIAARHSFNKWPPTDSRLFVLVVIICVPLALASLITPLLRITFLGPVLVNVSHKAIVFSCLFSFLLWYRNRLNVAWLGLLIGLMCAMVILSILASGGRRMVLSVFLGPLLAFYYLTARSWRPSRALVVLSIGTIALFVVSLMYSTIRHFDRRGGRTERSAAAAIDAMKHVDKTLWYSRFSNDALFNFSQHVVHYGLLVDRFTQTGQLEVKPLNTFHFILTYPIPRRIFPQKPRSLGYTITHQALGRSTSWGTGVAGHAKYEGGVFVAAMFGYFAVFLVRLFDDPLQRQPTNPFLIGMLASAGMHWIAWPRGDLAVMTFEVVECLIFAWALGFFCRIFFGTAPVSKASSTSSAARHFSYSASQS